MGLIAGRAAFRAMASVVAFAALDSSGGTACAEPPHSAPAELRGVHVCGKFALDWRGIRSYVSQRPVLTAGRRGACPSGSPSALRPRSPQAAVRGERPDALLDVCRSDRSWLSRSARASGVEAMNHSLSRQRPDGRTYSARWRSRSASYRVPRLA